MFVPAFWPAVFHKPWADAVKSSGGADWKDDGLVTMCDLVDMCNMYSTGSGDLSFP